MKKFLCLSLIFIFIFTLCACGEPDGPETTTLLISESTQAVPESTVSADESTSAAPETTRAGTYGKIRYKMESTHFSIEDEDGRPLFSGSVNYPFFFGGTEFEQSANEYFSDFAEEFRNRYTSEELLGKYGRPQEVAYRQKYDFQISYMKKGIMSFEISEYSFFGDENVSVRGASADIEKLRKLETEEYFTGTDAERQKAYYIYFRQQNPEVAEAGYFSSYKDASPYFTEGGLVFNVYRASGAGVLTTVIPFTDGNSYAISAPDIIAEFGKQ